VVIRWVNDTHWVILQAEGDVLGPYGLTILMAEMLEPLFPYKRVTKYDVSRIKFDEYTIRDDQRVLLTDFLTIISDLIKHFDTN